MKKIKEMLYLSVRHLLFRFFPEGEQLVNCQTNMFLKNNYNQSVISSKVKIFPPSTIYKSTIGQYSYLQSNSYLAYTDVGKFCSIGPNFTSGRGLHPLNVVSTSPMFYSRNALEWSISSHEKYETCPKVVIGNDVFIGANVTVINGVTIGDGAVIGAGAVVSKNIPPYAIAVGCPIKILRYRFNPDQIEKLLKIQWWNFPEEKLSEVETLEFDVDAFIEEQRELWK